MAGKPSINKRHRTYATLVGGGLGAVVAVGLASVGCISLGLPWDVMMQFAALYGGVSGAGLGFLLDTLLTDN